MSERAGHTRDGWCRSLLSRLATTKGNVSFPQYSLPCWETDMFLATLFMVGVKKVGIWPRECVFEIGGPGLVKTSVFKALFHKQLTGGLGDDISEIFG